MLVVMLWSLGALIGVAAAERRGFSKVAGFFGGLVLGPLFAPLMYFVSGVTRGGENKKCHACAEWIKAEARVCKHCRSAVMGQPALRRA